MSEHFLHTLFDPQSMVIAGASAREDSIGYRVVENVLAGGYRGKLWLVNSRYKTIFDQPAYKSIRALPETPELAVIVTPEPTLARMVKNCAEQGIPTVLIMTNCADTTPLQELATELGVRLLGPGSAGLIRPACGLNVTYSGNQVTAGKLALISHSATLASSVIDWADGKDIGFSALASIGAEADIDVAELVDFLGHDLATRAIIIYLDRVRDSRAFLSAIAEAARHKPVLVMKPTQDSEQLKTTPDQIGETLHADRVMQAALDRAGVVRIKTFSNLFSAARILASGIRTRGRRLGVVANGAAPAMLACDRIRTKGFLLPALPESVSDKLNEQMNNQWSAVNPIIVRNYRNMPASYTAAVDAMLQSNEYDTVLALYVPDNWCDPLVVAEGIAALPNPGGKPLLTNWMGEHQVAASRKHFQKNNIPGFRTPEAAADAFDFLYRHYRTQQLLLQLPDPVSDLAPVDFGSARQLVCRALERRQSTLSDNESLALLRLLGLLVPEPWSTTHNESQGHQGTLILRVFQDATFGPCISLGIGGPLQTLFPEPPMQLPPLNGFLIDDMLNDTELQRYLGTKDLTPLNLTALKDLLQRVSDMVCEIPEIDELELHPLHVNSDGLRIGSVRIAIRPSQASTQRYEHLAVHPYPREWTRSVTLKDETSMVLRPIRPEDGDGIRQLVRNMSPEARYMRFMHAVDELPPRMLAQFSKIDYDRQMAFCARPGSTDTELAGVARYSINPDGSSSEFAIAIADHWQGKGLAKKLMTLLIEHARSHQLHNISGEVLSRNKPMRGLMESMGFECLPDAKSPELLVCRMPLEVDTAASPTERDSPTEEA